MFDVPNFEQLENVSLAISTPLMSREKFAQALGLPTGVIVGWINKGLLPTVTVGRYSLINIAVLHRVCSQKEFSL